MRAHGLARLLELHSLGRDCRLTAARDVLHYFGFAHSPAMVYGLSSSYNFTYRRASGSRRCLLFPDLGDVARDYFLPVSGHRLEVFENLAYLYNGTLIRGEGTPLEALVPLMRGHLAEQIPFLVAVSQEKLLQHTGFRHSWPRYLNVSGFGGHWVQVVALDERARTVTLLESNLRTPVTIGFEAFDEARVYGDEHPDFLMKSRGRWAVLVPSSAPPPLPELIRGALIKVVYHMSDTASPSPEENGMAALRSFTRDFPAWPETLPLGKYKASLFMIKTASEGLLSGSLGRRGFGIFLRRASTLLAQPALTLAAQAYADAGLAWERLVQCIDSRVLDAEDDAVLPAREMASICSEVHERESAAFALLAGAVGVL